MEIKEAIHCIKASIDEEVCEECPVYGQTGTDHCEADACRLAIEALQEKAEREENKPLTLEQLNNMIGEFVFVKYKNGKVICDKVRYIDSLYCGFIHLLEYGGVFNFNMFEFYKYKPKEENR